VRLFRCRVGDRGLGGAQRRESVRGRHTQVSGVPFAGQVAYRPEALGGQQQHQIRAGGGGGPGDGRPAGEQRGGHGAALDGQVGESGVDQ
jgi:hypothetical protein